MGEAKQDAPQAAASRPEGATPQEGIVSTSSLFKDSHLYKTPDKTEEKDYTDEEVWLFLNFELGQMMTPAQADLYIKKQRNTVSGAIKRHEIIPLRCPGTEQPYVTPLMLGRWMLTYWQQ